MLIRVFIRWSGIVLRSLILLVQGILRESLSIGKVLVPDKSRIFLNKKSSPLKRSFMI